ncbi:hypothetical protein JCM10908_002024 [Rhodotorula pacifica]|uniref:uncharacterized protein n=1 Tax=Rhodotorula pacifica TaxID=1495444 RepID=UPI0031802EF8
MIAKLLLACALALASASQASPLQQVVFGAAPAVDNAGLPKIPHHTFNPLDHMSGIAPYHDAPNANITPPETCAVVAAAFLIRHSSIYANDDEWEEYMEPFAERVKKAQKSGDLRFPEGSPLAFLAEWECPINDDNLEKVTEPGIEDAYQLGKRFRDLYGQLMPPKHLGKKGHRHPGDKRKKGKGKKGGELRKDRSARARRRERREAKELRMSKPKVPFKVWSASSGRDVETSKAWVRGAFPHWQNGKDGEGDSEIIKLVAVPNKDPNWSDSLTPHKICDAFSKEAGKPEAQAWLDAYGPPIVQRINQLAEGIIFELNDVIAMQMLCGYETVIYKNRTSPFCSNQLFQNDEFRAFGYWNDLHYHAFVGYGSKVAPYLGAQWLNVSTHNLLSAYAPKHPHPDPIPTTFAGKLAAFFKPKLPAPELPPNATHTQLLFPYFTHREEPPVALVALRLWNTTSEQLPTDSMPKDRLWKTSHLLPFLGHVAIERLSCNAPATEEEHVASARRQRHKKDEYIRVLVNGAPQPLGECQDGPGGSCKMDEFAKFVEWRMELYGDIQGACKKGKA